VEKVWFGLVHCLFLLNPKLDPWFGSGYLAEPQTGPLVQIHFGPVQVQEGSEPKPNVNEVDNKEPAYVITPNVQSHLFMYHKRQLLGYNSEN